MLTTIYGLSTLIYAVTRIVQAPFALTVAVALPSSLLQAGIVVAILLTRLNGERRDGMPPLRWLRALRIPAWIAVAAIVVSALMGYLALSRFLAQQLIVTGSRRLLRRSNSKISRRTVYSSSSMRSSTSIKVAPQVQICGSPSSMLSTVPASRLHLDRQTSPCAT
jgi:hypothetical protein